MPRVYQYDDDWDTHEVYLQRPIKHGVLDYLAEEQYVVSPNKDACKDFNDGLSVLVEVGLVLGVGEESHWGEKAQKDAFEEVILLFFEENEDEDVNDLG